MKKEQHLKALFSQRFVAFMIDLILVSFITSLVTAIIPTNSSIDKLYNQQVKIVENYTSRKITMQEYVNQLVDINYDIAKQTGIITLVSIAISLLYYVLYVYKNDGQSIGKKMMKIRIQKKDKDKELTMNDLLFRTMILQGTLVSIIGFCTILFLDKDTYLATNSLLNLIQYSILIISFFLIAFTKERQGLHDMVAKTEVVCTNTVLNKEEEKLCEN
ncbi:MAG: RDD family protein [Clostridium sp.]|nr:RDD family protein [Clostridium sp.]